MKITNPSAMGTHYRNFFIGLSCLFALAAHAQYTIPDPAFATKLQQIVPNAMNGNMLDENHPDVTSLTSMTITASGIYDLDGLQFFTGLLTLNCQSNQLTSLPVLPNSMIDLRCGYNQLTSLPALPSSLTVLRCGYNQLASLPALPNSLTDLRCERGQLTSLPALPNSLTKLYCDNNQLTSLPALPSTLSVLFCDNNQLTSLPVLPNSLTDLNCGTNPLSILPTLPNSLNVLRCRDNQLTSLPALPNSMTNLYCEDNQLTSLPALPNSIIDLKCEMNQLTSLPDLPSSLRIFGCWQNQLTSLPDLPNDLQSLWCHNNMLTCLPTLPTRMDDLRCYGNSINCLPNVPVWLTSSLYFNSAYLGFTPVLCSTTDPCFPPEAITGTLFNDANGNGVQDAGETAFLSGVAEAQPGNNLSGVDVNGSYGIPVQPGTYTVQGQAVLYHTLTTPAHNVTISAGMSVTDMHIGYQIVPGIYDLVAELTAGVTRPGFDNNVYLSVSNIGTEASTATINFDFDADQNWVSATVAPNAQAGNNATWSIAMEPGDTWTARVTLNTPASVTLGTGVQHQLTATPDTPDTTPDDNSATWTRTVVGSYDPNDKQSSVSSLTPTDVQNGAWIDYTIRFQNTGTFMAENVLITDTLPLSLQANTFRYVASSHSNYWYMEAGVLHVRYDHIQLPDSNANEPASHGFIKFRIMASTALMEGDAITNTANIYFDFNTPIITDPSIVPIMTPGVAISPRVLLGGPYEEATQDMSDGLRNAGLIPLSEPYTALGYVHMNSGGETTTAPVLSTTGDDAIVDWVVVELRSNTAPYSVLATKSALLQRDGDVVHSSGTGPVLFNLTAGDYRVAIRHRNHLGVMTDASLVLSTVTTVVDFSEASTLTYGSDAQATVGTRQVLWAGDSAGDGDLKYTGTNNDRDLILQEIGGTAPTSTSTGYLREDVNMDGVVKYTGANNDRDRILVSIGGTVPTNVVVEQLP